MFRLFKSPPHGWSAVVWELAIVTVGVLIALGAQQLVDSINRRGNVAQLTAALRSELADDRSRWEHMRASDDCSWQRLAAIEQWVRTAPAGATLYRPYRLFLWNMHSSTWDLAKTSPAASDIPLKERLLYASLYGAIDNWRLFFDEENKNVQEINALLFTADQPENRSQVPYRLSKARAYINRRKFNYSYLFTRFDELGIKPDDSQLTVKADDRALCAPLESAPR
jgi:hypothetical protein